MKEDFGFFNSKDHDRVYNAKDWADYFLPFFRTGVFNGHLQIIENEGMSVKANPGYAWIDGYKYHLWDEGVLDLEMASGNMNRKDSIVLRLDLTNKWIRIFCKTGSYYAGTATPPAPEISATVHEIVIAHISVAAGTTRITQSMIEDTRMNKEICGWVCGAVEQIDFSQITAQFEGFFADYRKNISDEFKQFKKNAGDYSDQFVAWVVEKKAEITTWKGKEEEEFDAWVQDFVNKWESWLLGETKGWQEEIIDWFNNLREQLTENAAVSLQEQIGNLNNLETENKDNLVSAVNSLCLSYDETMEVLAPPRTVTLTLSTDNGETVEDADVTLHNKGTGEDTVMKYSGQELVFDVNEGMGYIISFGSAGVLYSTPDKVHISSTSNGKLEINAVYRHRELLKDFSWEEIAGLSESGLAKTIFKIHDTKEIKLTTGENVEVEIVGFEHDNLADSPSEFAGITFGMKKCLAKEYRLHSTDKFSSVVEWDNVEMRTTTIRNAFYDVLPDDVRSVIKNVLKDSLYITVNSNGISTMGRRVVENDVWLFSASEVGLKANNIEPQPYPAFRDTGAAAKGTEYWTRTPDSKIESAGANVNLYTFEMKAVTGSGIIMSKKPNLTCGVLIGFCV